MGFQQGLSGLSAASKNLEVIGNNVANSNTYGEKSSRAEFADMYAAAMTGSASNNMQAGIGVQVAAVAQQFNQGNITPTGNPLDLAINGNGFFQTQDPSNQVQYTRNGQFKVNNDRQHRQRPGQQAAGLPGRRAGQHRAGRGQAAATAHRRHRPAAHHQEHHRVQPRLARRGDHARLGPGDRLHEPEDVQQRHLGDDVRRQGPGRRRQLLLPEDRHRHLRRLRHGQRHHGRRHRRTRRRRSPRCSTPPTAAS